MSKKFRTHLENEFMKFDISDIEFQSFHDILLSVLNENAPLKKILEQIMQGLLPKIFLQISPLNFLIKIRVLDKPKR